MALTRENVHNIHASVMEVFEEVSARSVLVGEPLAYRVGVTVEFLAYHRIGVTEFVDFLTETSV
jgi:hypothetical protein